LANKFEPNDKTSVFGRVGGVPPGNTDNRAAEKTAVTPAYTRSPGNRPNLGVNSRKGEGFSPDEDNIFTRGNYRATGPAPKKRSKSVTDNVFDALNSISDKIIPDVSGVKPEQTDVLRYNEAKRKAYNRAVRRAVRARFGSAVLACIIVVVSASLADIIVKSLLDYTGITSKEFELEIAIPDKAGVHEIARILKAQKIIDEPKFFEIYARSHSKGKFLSGNFKLDSTMSYKKIIEVLQTPPHDKSTVTLQIREGMTAEDIGKLLEENNVCRAADFAKYYQNKNNWYSFEERLEESYLKFHQLEGYLFPDTYEFYILDKMSSDPEYDTDEYAKTAANKIFSSYNDKITKEMYRRMYDMGLKLNDVMTLASMVQAEASTTNPEDMKNVASVFLNRLANPNKFPYFESDVTALYSLRVIRPAIEPKNEAMLRPIETAYNTYETKGLPPGPICNPGLDAVKAVLDAPKTDYFYFCADPVTMKMYFSKTLAEHEAVVRTLPPNPNLADISNSVVGMKH
jgi:UPF0755 protein